MKKFFALSATALTLAAVSQGAIAGQDSGPYIQGSIYGTDLTDTHLKSGGASVSYDSDIGYGLGGEFGYKFNKYLRAGIEATYRRNDVSGGGASGEFDSYAGLGNIYIDIPTGSPITPYIGAGAGYAYVTDTDLHDNVFAYQGMAGLSYAATPKLDIVLGYKYLGTTNPRYEVSGVSISAPYRVHNAELGFRFKF